MTEQAVKVQTAWYTRPVLFVADVNRALHFYVDMLGFEKRWHEGDGAGKVCQVNRGDCEIQPSTVTNPSQALRDSLSS